MARRRLRKFGAACSVVCGLLLSGLDASGQVPPSKEYQIKAVFLFNFAQFVEWPPAAFAGPGAPLIIGVLGEDPFGAFLDNTVKDEKVNNRPLQVERYERLDDIKTCHVLFVGRSEASRLTQILAGLRHRSVLIVSDADDFVRQGGMIQLATVQNKVHLMINVEATRTASLTISSKLLRSAEVVASSK